MPELGRGVWSQPPAPPINKCGEAERKDLVLQDYLAPRRLHGPLLRVQSLLPRPLEAQCHRRLMVRRLCFAPCSPPSQLLR